MGRDKAVVAISAAGAPGDHLTVHDQRPGRVAARLDLRLPPHLAGLRANADNITVGRGVKNQILKDPESLGAPANIPRPLVFPDRRACCRIESAHGARRQCGVHHAVVNKRNRFRRSRGHVEIEDHLELSDILFVDLLQRAVALGIIRPAEHQPIIRTRVLQHLLGHRSEPRSRGLRRLRQNDQRHQQQHQNDGKFHGVLHNDGEVITFRFVL